MTTTANLIVRVRRRCDMVGSGFVTDAEILDYINQALGELQDDILRAHGAWAYTETSTTTCATSGAIALPSFRKMLRIEWTYTDGRRYPMRRLEPANIVREGEGQDWYPGQVGYWISWNSLGAAAAAIVEPPPKATTAVTLTMVPTWALTTTSGEENRYGYDDLLVCRAAILVRQKEESDTRELTAELERHLQRIAQRPQDDRGPPRQMPRALPMALRVRAH